MEKDIINTTSKGLLQELEDVIGNLLAANEHLLEILPNNPQVEELMNKIREERQKLMYVYSGGGANLEYHCLFKHLLLSKTLLREVVTTNASKLVFNQFDLLKSLETIDSLFQQVRPLYLDITDEDVKDPYCSKCLEDYLSVKDEREEKKN